MARVSSWELGRKVVNKSIGGNHEHMSSNPWHLHKEPGMAAHPVTPALRDRERRNRCIL